MEPLSQVINPCPAGMPFCGLKKTKQGNYLISLDLSPEKLLPSETCFYRISPSLIAVIK
jgi:hypothetical protein